MRLKVPILLPGANQKQDLRSLEDHVRSGTAKNLSKSAKETITLRSKITKLLSVRTCRRAALAIAAVADLNLSDQKAQLGLAVTVLTQSSHICRNPSPLMHGSLHRSKRKIT